MPWWPITRVGDGVVAQDLWERLPQRNACQLGPGQGRADVVDLHRRGPEWGVLEHVDPLAEVFGLSGKIRVDGQVEQGLSISD
jgi:hypothetical protein